MIVEELRGIGISKLQCWSCRNSPIIDKEQTMGFITDDVRQRLEQSALKHEQRHPEHRMTLTIFTQDIATETKQELPIVGEMRLRFQSQR